VIKSRAITRLNRKGNPSNSKATLYLVAEEEGFDSLGYDSRDLLAHVGSLHSPCCKQSIYEYPHKQAIFLSPN
jgi:hypothetical protein